MKKLRQSKYVKYSNDLSSYNIWAVLCELLKRIAIPLFTFSDTGKETMLSCVSLTANKSRKISYKDADETLPIMFHLAAKAYKEDMTYIDEFFETGVERNILEDHIKKFILSDKPLNNSRIDKEKLIKHIDSYLDLYYTFRTDVLHRYRYLIEAMANRDCAIKAKQGLVMNPESMQNNYFLVTYRAIDKFAPNKGTLTSYIKQWIPAARSSRFILYDGEAIDVDRSERQKIHNLQSDIKTKAIPIEDRQDELLIDPIDIEDNSSVHYSAKHKYATLLFLNHNLEYPLNKKQRERIHAWNIGRSSLRSEGTS